MVIKDLFKQSTKETIIITTPENKRYILKKMYEEGVFHPVSFLHKQDLFERLYFKFKPSACYEASRFLNKKPAIANAMMAFLHKIDLNTNYQRPRLNELQVLKKHLMPYMSESPFKSTLFSNKRIIVYGQITDAHYLTLIETLKASYTIEFYSPFITNETEHHTYTAFKSVEEELTDLAIKIRDLHAQEIPFSDITLANVPTDYGVYLKNIFSRFGIPLNMTQSTPLSSYSLTQKFYETLKTSSHESFKKAIEDSLLTIKPFVSDQTAARVFQKLMRVLNPLIRFIDNIEDGITYVWYVLSHTTLSALTYEDAVKVKPLDTLAPIEDQHCFIVAMREGNAPSFKEEDDFLNQAEKQSIGIPCAHDENSLAKKVIDDLFEHFNALHFSFAETSPTSSYLPSSHFNIYSDRVTPLNPSDTVYQPYSELTDLLETKYERDRYDLYGEEGPRLKTLHPLFESRYNTYSNRFTGLSNDTVKQLLTRKNSLSVTQIEDYYKCPFTFLLKHFLRLDPDDSPFYRDLGTFFHDVLEKHIDKEELTDDLLDQELEGIIANHKKRYTSKDLYFFRKTFESLKKAHAIIKSQEQRTTYQVEQRETALEKQFHVNGHTLYFKGKIDKVLAYDDRVVLIDYKTGKATLDIKNALHGLNAQLLYYVLLYKATHNQAKPLGFFEQTILPPTFNKDKNKSYDQQVQDYFAWQGYSSDDLDEIAKIDPDFESEPMVKGLRVKNDGTLAKTSKVIDFQSLDILLEKLQTLVDHALNNIVSGDFPITPKRINGKDVSCQYCPFEDICYKTNRDYINLYSPKNTEDFFESLKGEDE